jgi:hypothetical protein
VEPLGNIFYSHSQKSRCHQRIFFGVVVLRAEILVCIPVAVLRLLVTDPIPMVGLVPVSPHIAVVDEDVSKVQAEEMEDVFAAGNQFGFAFSKIKDF